MEDFLNKEDYSLTDIQNLINTEAEETVNLEFKKVRFF